MDGTVNTPAASAAPVACDDALHGLGDEAAPISRIVAEVAALCPGERITLRQMSEAFGDRAFGLLILLLLLPSLLPGMASVFGTPVLILGVQMGLGRREPKLPDFIARQSIKREDLLRLAGSSSKWVSKIERFVKPRPGIFISPFGDKLFGWLTAYVALMLILPGPGTNGPPAFGNIVMALGLVEHDNRTTAWGVGLTIAGCIFATFVLVALGWLGIKALGWVF
jgi:hypothetical protein